ncbi:threonine-phosphate decarboxylase CobD [Tropicibacter sp. Alg240-R139]|uniref:threonine-phosphate decarboxylase CobD n=1 Tax=Tropicibacter sp. Alg240-R139 TaxID=2305991 RepID=UPI0013DECE9B|nr:threonine-phosphate decarboxylase CobD [Tropicibacter sp. Alg240-R139]
MAELIDINPRAKRDHGGGLAAARQQFGGAPQDWVDLSTGINPAPFPVQGLTAQDWAALPDHDAFEGLVDAARTFWNAPHGAAILPAPGASALIARLPVLVQAARVEITPPTYNEHAAAFSAQGWQVTDQSPAQARVLVHPNNPDGRLWSQDDATGHELTVIDESFCDVTPEASLIHLAEAPNTVVLKSFGKFWGLAGLRLGFAIARPDIIARLNDLTGPWAVSGPALRVGTQALHDLAWAEATRIQLACDAERLDTMMTAKGASIAGGTSLFRLYHVDDAKAWQAQLAEHHIWSRVFPYSDTFLRLGLPPADRWAQLERAL